MIDHFLKIFGYVRQREIENPNVPFSMDTTVLETIDENYEFPPETVVEEVKTEDVTGHTMLLCPTCQCNSYFKDGSCVKCDRGII